MVERRAQHPRGTIIVTGISARLLPELITELEVDGYRVLTTDTLADAIRLAMIRRSDALIVGTSGLGSRPESFQPYAAWRPH